MTTLLHERAREYVLLRRALGYKMGRTGGLLAQFASHLEQHGDLTVTAARAIEWAQLPQGVRSSTWANRLTVIRGFASWLSAIDPATEIPPRGVFPGYGKRPAPFIFSEDDIARLMAASARLRPAGRAATCTALFGLIAVTGIRIGEALAIPAGGIDLGAGLLTVMPAKTRCERILPLHPTAVTALAEYAALRDHAHPRAATFFASRKGTPVSYDSAWAAFRRARDAAGIPGRARIHDLRHSLAVSILLEWYRSGEDVAAQLPALSGYLGHLSPEQTYWYISAVPELMHLAAGRVAGKEAGGE